MREWLNQNPKVVIVIAAASLSILLGIVVELVIPTNGYRAKDYEKEWLYNLNTGELFTAEIGRFKITPTPASGEPAVAKAYVFSYAYEPNESERFIGFLEVPDPAAQRSDSPSDQSTSHAIGRWGRGKLIRRLDDEQWVPGDSEQGRTILAEVFVPDKNGETPGYCRPQ